MPPVNPRTRRTPLVAASLGAALLILLGVTTVAPRPTVAGAIGLVVVGICLAALYRATYAGFFAPVAVTFWAFVAVWVGFAPLLQIRDNVLPWRDTPLYQHYVTAQVILLLAVLAFWAGYHRRTARPARPDVDAPRDPDPAPAPPTGPAWRRALAARLHVTVEKAVALTGVATVLAAICLPITGGLAVRFATRDVLKQAINDAGLVKGDDQALVGLLGILPASVAMVALVLCLLCWRDRRWADRRAKWILAGATAVAVTLNVIYNNPLSANRFAAFSVVLAAGFALIRFDTLRWRAAFSSAMLLGLAVLYPLANLFRNERSRANLRLGLDAYYTNDFDGFQQTVNSVFYVDVYGHTWGHHLISALLFWVPRSIWEGKAIGAGNVVAASRGYDFQNLSLPFWAEVFLEFSLVGVVVLFFFYGRMARFLDYSLRDTRAGLIPLLTILFAACQIGLLRGPLGAQIPFAGAAFGVAVISVVAWRGHAWRLTAAGPAAALEPRTTAAPTPPSTTPPTTPVPADPDDTAAAPTATATTTQARTP